MRAQDHVIAGLGQIQQEVGAADVEAALVAPRRRHKHHGRGAPAFLLAGLGGQLVQIGQAQGDAFLGRQAAQLFHLADAGQHEVAHHQDGVVMVQGAFLVHGDVAHAVADMGQVDHAARTRHGEAGRADVGRGGEHDVGAATGGTGKGRRTRADVARVHEVVLDGQGRVFHIHGDVGEGHAAAQEGVDDGLEGIIVAAAFGEHEDALVVQLFFGTALTLGPAHDGVDDVLDEIEHRTHQADGQVDQHVARAGVEVGVGGRGEQGFQHQPEPQIGAHGNQKTALHASCSPRCSSFRLRSISAMRPRP